MCKCTGCGVCLQNSDKESIGYTANLNNNLCERCFKIRNYNEYKLVLKDNKDYIDILKKISDTDDLVVLVVDLFNLGKDFEELNKHLNNNILLVLTKRDILPKSVYDKKLLEYFNNCNLNILDSVIISSVKNYNFDLLYEKINKYKSSNNVYVVGYTNSGKSTMINKLLHNYSDSDMVITTSNLPSTTIDLIKVKLNEDLTIIDTPGLLYQNDIINFVEKDMLKKIIPNREIKPITYQIKSKQIILIENILRLDIFSGNNITIYMSNNLNIRRFYKETNELIELEKINLKVLKNSDVVIKGLGFIKFTKAGNVTIFIKKGIEIFVRENLI